MKLIIKSEVFRMYADMFDHRPTKIDRDFFSYCRDMQLEFNALTHGFLSDLWVEKED